MSEKRKKILKAVQSAIIDWEVNDVEMKLRYKKKKPRLLIDVITDALMKESELNKTKDGGK